MSHFLFDYRRIIHPIINTSLTFVHIWAAMNSAATKGQSNSLPECFWRLLKHRKQQVWQRPAVPGLWQHWQWRSEHVTTSDQVTGFKIWPPGGDPRMRLSTSSKDNVQTVWCIEWVGACAQKQHSVFGSLLVWGTNKMLHVLTTCGFVENIRTFSHHQASVWPRKSTGRPR